MQIFPNSTSTATIDSLFNAGTTSSSTDSFSAHLQLAQKTVQHAIQKAEDYSTSEPLTEAPYSSNTKTDSALYSFDEVGFTKAELFQLHQELVREGAQPELLDKLRVLIEKPDGATISQVLASLNQENTPIQLSESEQTALNDFLTKIDSTGELGYKVNSLLESGQGLEAWSAISQKLSSMDPSQGISINKSEVAIIGKALGLSEQNQAQLLSGFGDSTSFTLKPSELQKFFSPAQSGLGDEHLNQEKLQKALETSLGPILQKAKDRFQDAKDAASLESKNVQHSDIVIKKTVTEKATNNLEQTALENTANNAEQATAPKAASNLEQTVLEKNTVPTQNSTNIKDNNLNLDTNKILHNTVQNNDAAKDNNSSNPEHSKQNADSNNPNRDSSWDNLLGKVEVNTSATKSDASFSNLTGVQNIHNPLSPENMLKDTQTSSSRLGYNEQNVANQVERGLLTAMKNGATKLELQLNPDNLGTINLILTSTAGGEISASIRADRSETVEVMQRQLDVIRVNLEQQGIKIDKLEVHYESSDKQSNDPWKDLQQHNSQQEQHARQEQLERLRNLRAVRNSGTNSNNTTLEQNMHMSTISANSATTSLHIVA